MIHVLYVIADLHIGNHRAGGGLTVCGRNHRGREGVARLSRFLRLPNVNQTHVTVAFCGDIFDVAKPPPQLMADVAEAFGSTLARKIVIVGNHDRFSAAPGDHCLGYLAALPRVRVVDEPETLPIGGGTRILALPAVPRGKDPDAWVKERLSDLEDKWDIALAHVGIAHDGTPPFLAGHGVKVETIRRCLDHRQWFLAGDWHARYDAGPSDRIIQIGAFTPTGWDNPVDRVFDPSDLREFPYQWVDRFELSEVGSVLKHSAELLGPPIQYIVARTLKEAEHYASASADVRVSLRLPAAEVSELKRKPGALPDNVIVKVDNGSVKTRRLEVTEARQRASVSALEAIHTAAQKFALPGQADKVAAVAKAFYERGRGAK